MPLVANPNLYLRAGAAPTLSHYQYGNYGSALYDRSLSASGGSEYGNWVPFNGRFEAALTNGIWYLAVQAGGNSNVRYRLRMDTGIITNLSSRHAGGATNQQMAAGDWLYYALTWSPTNAPVNWNVNFSVQLGSVVMYVRDRVPPGEATTVTDYRDWSSSYDYKKSMARTCPTVRPAHYALPCPPLRPGNTYYLGFRAVADATFALSSSTSAANIDYTNVIPFYHGYVSNTIPSFGLLKYRVDVPANADRWISSSTNASSVWLYLDQGSAPTLTTADDWYSAGYVNSYLNEYFADAVLLALAGGGKISYYLGGHQHLRVAATLYLCAERRRPWLGALLWLLERIPAGWRGASSSRCSWFRVPPTSCWIRPILSNGPCLTTSRLRSLPMCY